MVIAENRGIINSTRLSGGDKRSVGMEIWDAYRADGSLAGCDLVRGEPIPPGLFHLVSEVLARHTDGGYLLMQRDWRK